MIRERLLWGFVLIALLPLLGVALGTSLVSYYNGRQQSLDRLESVAARKELAIENWANALQAELQVASQTDYSPRFVSNAMRLSNEGKRYEWYNSLVRKRLQALLDQSSEYEELFLLDLAGKVVVSTNPAPRRPPIRRRVRVSSRAERPGDPAAVWRRGHSGRGELLDRQQ